MKLEEKHQALAAEKSQCEARTKVNHEYLLTCACLSFCVRVVAVSLNLCRSIILIRKQLSVQLFCPYVIVRLVLSRKSKKRLSSSSGRTCLSKQIQCLVFTKRGLLRRLNSKRYVCGSFSFVP